MCKSIKRLLGNLFTMYSYSVVLLLFYVVLLFYVYWLYVSLI